MMREQMHNQIRRPMRKPLRWIAAFIIICASAIACSDYAVVSPTLQTDEFYWAIKVDHPAVLLSMTAPTNTLQLHATPYTIHGDTLVVDSLITPSHIVWESSDTMTVHVSQAGILTARKTATRVNVYATLTVGDITRRDTVWVGVTATAPSALDSFVLFVPSKASVVPAGGSLSLSVRARLENGSLVSGVPVRYYVNNRWLATFKTTVGLLYGIVPDDSVTVTAVTTVYGETRRDSLFLYTGWPVRLLTPIFTLLAEAAPNNSIVYTPRSIELKGGPGSTFTWANQSGAAPKNALGAPYSGGMKFDIIFDHPEAAGPFNSALPPSSPFGQSGNILQLPFDTAGGKILLAYRKFTAPGDHYYTMQPLGIRGKVSISER